MKPLWIVAFAASLAAASCNRATEAEQEAVIAQMWPRPPDVPLSAVLHAGEDGGHWADCRFEGKELACDIYHVRGGLEFRQAFRVCVNGEAGSLAGGVMGGEEQAFPVGQRRAVLVPAGPPQMADDQPELQQKADREFEDAQPMQCAVQLVPTQPE